MPHSTAPHIAIIGGGPAGLMAAETLSLAGMQVDVYDAMPSPGRKFLLAGIGGLNITHSKCRVRSAHQSSFVIDTFRILIRMKPVRKAHPTPASYVLYSKQV